MTQSLIRPVALALIGIVVAGPNTLAGDDLGSVKDAPATSYRWDGVYIGGGVGGS